MNTVYQGASWSTLDYSGSWKVSHNYIKNIFQPTLVTGFMNRSNPNNASLDIWAVSDLQDDIHNVNITVSFYRFDQQDS